MTVLVWFCSACNDQASWKNDELVECPGCGLKTGVWAAQRFQNMEEFFESE